jgi:hypothetical protein
MLSGSSKYQFIVFGLTQLVLKHTMYRTQGEHANHYTNDVVLKHTMYHTQGEHANHYTQ